MKTKFNTTVTARRLLTLFSAAFLLIPSPAFAEQSRTEVIDVATVPNDWQATQGLKLCMTLEEFQSGPGKAFTLSLRASTPASRVFTRQTEWRYLANYLLFRDFVRVPVGISVEFGGEHLRAVRLLFSGQSLESSSRAEGIYTALREQLLQGYAIGPVPTGPVFMDEQTLSGRRNVLLFDKQGNSSFLDFFRGDKTVLTFYARGYVGSPGDNAVQVVLGRFPKFCEEP